MIVLSDEQLKDIAAGLPTYYPKSVQLDCIIRNKLRNQCVWPGTELVADEFPDYSVLMYRPIAGSTDYVPWPRAYTVVIFCRRIEKLPELLRRDDFVNWSGRVCFFAVSKNDVFPSVVERCREMNTIEPYSEDKAIVHKLHPSYLIKRDLPEGFVLGELSEEHAEQVNSEWRYGGAETLLFMQALRRNKFPSSAIFTTEGRLVAYISYKVDGSMFHGFVHPDFRNKGLYQVLNYDLTEKVTKMGHPFAYVYVMEWNEVSLNAYRKLGAKQINRNIFSVDWQVFRPPPRDI